MPKIEIELTDETIANIANGEHWNVPDELIAAAKEIVATKHKASLISDLLLGETEVADETEAIEIVSLLTDAHQKIEDLLAKLGLEYELPVYLTDGRHLALTNYSYVDKGEWMTSSQSCY